VRVRAHGLGKIAPGQNYVFLSNHQGNFDGPVLFHVIPRDVRALVKHEMMRIPVLSLIMRQVKFVPIDRADVHKARAGIDYGAMLLRQGLSFFAFPEGTRSRDGRLGEFKKGVFVMAIKGQTPVMPITILNTSRIQSPGDYGIRPGTVEVIFHDPIPTQDMDLQDRNRLMESTRAAITSALAPAAQEPARLAN
jgi:1-acyl-sn-glycerol-3-phosphate acyltransferase